MAKFTSISESDESELDEASFKDNITEELTIYKKLYANYYFENGFSFNEGFILMKLAFLSNCIDQLAGATFAIEETINPSEEE